MFSTFSCTIHTGHLYVFLGKISIHLVCPFKNQIALFICLFVLLLSCMSSLYILDINPLSDIRVANIFSYSLGCLFILLLVSFAVQKVFLGLFFVILGFLN